MLLRDIKGASILFERETCICDSKWSLWDKLEEKARQHDKQGNPKTENSFHFGFYSKPNDVGEFFCEMKIGLEA